MHALAYTQLHVTVVSSFKHLVLICRTVVAWSIHRLGPWGLSRCSAELQLVAAELTHIVPPGRGVLMNSASMCGQCTQQSLLQVQHPLHGHAVCTWPWHCCCCCGGAPLVPFSHCCATFLCCCRPWPAGVPPLKTERLEPGFLQSVESVATDRVRLQPHSMICGIACVLD